MEVHRPEGQRAKEILGCFVLLLQDTLGVLLIKRQGSNLKTNKYIIYLIASVNDQEFYLRPGSYERKSTDFQQSTVDFTLGQCSSTLRSGSQWDCEASAVGSWQLMGIKGVEDLWTRAPHGKEEGIGYQEIVSQSYSVS